MKEFVESTWDIIWTELIWFIAILLPQSHGRHFMRRNDSILHESCFAFQERSSVRKREEVGSKDSETHAVSLSCRGLLCGDLEVESVECVPYRFVVSSEA